MTREELAEIFDQISIFEGRLDPLKELTMIIVIAGQLPDVLKACLAKIESSTNTKYRYAEPDQTPETFFAEQQKENSLAFWVDTTTGNITPSRKLPTKHSSPLWKEVKFQKTEERKADDNIWGSEP